MFKYIVKTEELAYGKADADESSDKRDSTGLLPG